MGLVHPIRLQLPMPMSDQVQLFLGDCLDILPTLNGQVDAIITDLPYGTTACAWDNVILFEPMWKEVKRLLKPRGVFVTTASQPFTSKLVMSNLEWFKYEIIWEKSCSTGFVHAKNKPMKKHENILVFSNGVTVHASQSDNRMTYNPQMEIGIPYKKHFKSLGQGHLHEHSKVNKDFIGTTVINDGFRYPKSILNISNSHGINTLHTTEKPVALYAYLIRTYTNDGDTVLDFCMGSGTTGVAAVQLGRRFIGVEIDPAYFAIAEKRIKQAQQQMLLPLDMGKQP